MTRVAEKIGTLTTTNVRRERQTFECAAWYRDYDCPPQTVDVFLTRNPEGWPSMLHWGLSGVCVDACLVPLFGGVAIGPDRGRETDVGQPGKVSTTCYAYNAKNLPGLTLDPEYVWLLDETSWPRAVADRRLAWAKRNGYVKLDDLRREINVDWMRANGSPELVAEFA